MKEKKEKNSILLMLALVLFIIGIIYVFGMIAKSFAEKPIKYTNDNIEEYISKSTIVNSNVFYILDSKVANFLEAVDREMYSDLYSILADNYNKIYSRSDIISSLKRYRSEVFKYNDGNEHKYIGHLKNAYLLEDGNYLVNLDFNEGNFYLIIGNSRNGYSFAIVE